MLPRVVAALCFATSLAACVADGSSTDDTATAGGGGKADGQTPSIVFDGQWHETLSGTLLAGDRVRIDYDLDRLTTCRGSTGGSEVWGVTGYASFDGGEPQAFAVSRLDSSGHVQPVVASVSIPASAAAVAFWFAINNRWGCIAYDSNNDQNYVFDIHHNAAGAVLSFDADWTESQSAALHAGAPVVVHYAPERLAQCASSSGGHASWGITASYRVDGGTTHSVTVGTSDGSTLVAADPTITLPRGRDLELWFEATNVYGCHAYDSSESANYHFTIE